jgi:hypothetical protein
MVEPFPQTSFDTLAYYHTVISSVLHAFTCALLQAGVADSLTGTDSGSSSSSSELLSQRVKGNGQLITGQLSNGLRYVLLPNRTPPQRFEAHLEVHAGSVDEREHEQVRYCCMLSITAMHVPAACKQCPASDACVGWQVACGAGGAVVLLLAVVFACTFLMCA